jgi:beta-lactam-binding protein with PASTA domain
VITRLRVGVAILLAGLSVGEAAGFVASPASAATKKKVPNVVGKNHQAAQDFLQSRGFFNLREKDCSGRGRLLLFDRNWKVVRQSPKAGRRVSTNRAITLCSVKYSD